MLSFYRNNVESIDQVQRRARRGGLPLPRLEKFQGKRKLLKNPECKKDIQYSEKFQGKRKVAQILNGEEFVNTMYSVYIHMGVIRVPCVHSVVCGE